MNAKKTADPDLFVVLQVVDEGDGETRIDYGFSVGMQEAFREGSIRLADLLKAVDGSGAVSIEQLAEEIEGYLRERLGVDVLVLCAEDAALVAEIPDKASDIRTGGRRSSH